MLWMIKNDKYFMCIALNLAYRGLGVVAPNPAVGCLIVKGDVIIGRGWTQAGGRPHAEYIAINNAVANTKGATLYTTLEPCVHYAQTSPCVDLIIKAQIKRVVIAIKDPDQRVNGKGLSKLKDCGIKIEYGVCQEEAKQLNIGYFYNRILNRPYVTVKLATTADGKIATQTGESKWITSEMARKFSHKLRAQNDAIMIGTGTLIQDNPLLNCRLPGLEKYSPIKIVTDNKGKLNNSHLVLQDKEVLTFTNKKIIDGLHKTIESKSLDNGQVDLQHGMRCIADYGITRLLVEGGGKLLSSLINDEIVNQIIWIRSSKIAGNDAKSAIHNLNIYHISDLFKFKLKKIYQIGKESVEVLVKEPYLV